MKHFFRTAIGKTVLFIICVVSVISLALSALGIAGLMSQAREFYLQSEEGFLEMLYTDRLRSDGYSAIWQMRKTSDKELLPDCGNAVFIIRDQLGTVLARSAGSSGITNWKYSMAYMVFRADDGGFDIEYIGEANGAGPVTGEEGTEIYTVSFAFKSGFPEMDMYAAINRFAPVIYKLRYWIFAIAAVSLLAAILSFVGLMSVSGKRAGTEEIVPGPFSRIPFDLMAAAAAGLTVLMAFICDSLDGSIASVIAACITAVIALCMLLGLCMTFSARVKQGTFLRNNIITKVMMLLSGCLGFMWGLVKKVFGYFSQGFRNIPVVWKTVLAFCGFTFLELILIVPADDAEGRLATLTLERALLLPSVVFIAMILRRLYDGGKALAGGELSHYTDTKGMFWDLKAHGEDLNSIAKGMAIAVDDRLRSERMKTELITNVSHDIKTPLTSIINYATLIGEEQCDNEKIQEYSEVLVRQSERLKRLIEDLVEASKASTGNLDVEPVPCDASVFLNQASGEYSEKLEAADLTLVTKAPENEMTIMADGRRMWRIFDNLMNNICKYAMPGTRVYLSLEEENGSAVFTFKNTSRDELNISEEELMERFTRGDSSRNTEGNGLGLSIARSMAELQGGTLNLSIDGDLFKAILAFPVIG